MIGRAIPRLKPAGTALRSRWRKRPGLRRFLREAGGGATAIVAGAVTVMTVGASALIVDHNWLVDQRDVLKSASDAAGVAATLELERLPPETTDEALDEALQQVAENYVALNLHYLPADRLAKARETLTVGVTPDRLQKTVDIAAQANLGGTLLSKHMPIAGNYSGPSEIRVAAQVESMTSPVEVVLAIDISESMRSLLNGTRASWMNRDESRIEIVKRAALELVDILDPDEANRVAIGVVPWQIAVRLDETARANWAANGWAVYPQSRHYDAAYMCKPEGNCTAIAVDDALPADPGEAWLGCLDEHRVDSLGHADLPAAADLLALPSDSAFAQAIYPALEGKAFQCLEPPLPANFSGQACYGQDAHDQNRVFDNVSPQFDCRDGVSPILPLTADRAAIEATIGALLPLGIRTYSSLGVLWGQRLLSHGWQAVWGGDVHPVDASSGANAGTRKAIVLLTDGEDNPCGLQDPFCTTNNVGLVRSVACSAAKAAGTEIFVVAAMSPQNVSSALETSLRACSSEADNPDGTYVFVNNSDGDSLEQAFADIAQQLKIVRRVY